MPSSLPPSILILGSLPSPSPLPKTTGFQCQPPSPLHPPGSRYTFWGAALSLASRCRGRSGCQSECMSCWFWAFAISQWKFLAFSVLLPPAVEHLLPRRKLMQMHAFDSIPKSDKYDLVFNGFNGRYERVGTGATPTPRPCRDVGQ